MTHPIHIIDSHTAGEPTRIVIAGGPDLGTGTVAQRVEIFRAKHDRFRSAVVNEPRGSDVLVGALLCEPSDNSCVTGVIFFNNVGFLGMCGHGTIGLIATLAHLGRITPGSHRIETNVGIVSATLHNTGEVSVDNVPSHRTVKDLPLKIPGHGTLHGDIAWGGNWFFLVSDHGQTLDLKNVDALTDLSWRIRQTVNQTHPEIDHVELFAPPPPEATRQRQDASVDPPATLASWRPAHSRNFVLCPGKAYDRSPCGTGTSAKLACLAADGKLDEGQQWIQESILGTRFAGHFKWLDRAKGIIAPTITGSAFITADAKLLLDERDPFQWGIRG